VVWGFLGENSYARSESPVLTVPTKGGLRGERLAQEPAKMAVPETIEFEGFDGFWSERNGKNYINYYECLRACDLGFLLSGRHTF